MFMCKLIKGPPRKVINRGNCLNSKLRKGENKNRVYGEKKIKVVSLDMGTYCEFYPFMSFLPFILTERRELKRCVMFPGSSASCH